MLGLALARALEADWRELLDAAGRRRGWPTSRDVGRLAARVVELSAAYNDPARARAAMTEAGAARLGFAFARDVPKAAAALRELIVTGRVRLACESEPLRVLDIGAGLGASTWGALRALVAAGARGAIDATWVDSDGPAMEVALELARSGRATPMHLRVRSSGAPIGSLAHLGRFDLVLVGQLLSELDLDLPDTQRVERHAALIAAWLEGNVDERGSLMLVEPALRDRTRHLHRVRDALASRPGVTVFAPCLHAAPCPALARETDWCHEDLPVDLPPWLVPVAQAAGLRREGLTFSYLVLRRDGARLADALPACTRSARLRVVSDPMPSKGKREVFACGELSSGDTLVPGRARLMRLDRDASAHNAGWEDLARGELLAIAPPPKLDRPRIGAESVVELVRTLEPR